MTEKWTRRRAIRAGGILAGIGLAGCSASTESNGGAAGDAEQLSVDRARQYSGPGCSCCGEYATYLDGHLDGEFTETTAENLDAVKAEHGVPGDLVSCHTVVVEDYVVEGHVPVEAIATLLEERPAVDGIALPGMPPGSPGMPGQQDGSLTVYAFTDGERGDVFTEL